MMILRAVAAAAVFAIVGALAGEVWFYATGETNALTSEYGEIPVSGSYVRTAGGFGTSALLGSFTIAAAALLLGWLGDGAPPRRLAVVLGVLLGIICVLTISRAPRWLLGDDRRALWAAPADPDGREGRPPSS